ncbi:C40 family peptidase [Solimicrobium silvestre]|uniref:Prokaryotic homologs of the JAB domain n=1 Tax=Solimicrobium silvestre TaxID=2099400 RepID=A0A2S9GZQ2_9BURK|nr:C40 family peptidase [Solimicrobium silvestre]PRC93096.1 Prokaryotic homologs of the JAB domain [Solimicrobium silvestre]
MKPKTLTDIKRHAEADYPREACGLIIIRRGREKYLPCKNLAPDTEHFIISAQDYAVAEEMGEIVAVVHSHPDAPASPSEADKVSCEASGVLWHIIRVDGTEGIPTAGELITIEPCGYQVPLVGRQFFHGVLDCYSLIRDWYQQTRSIELKQFSRADEWWNDGKSDLYTQGFPQAGFVSIESNAEMQVGDVILMQIRSTNGVPNHAAIYIGDGLILHHLHGHLSSRDVYGGYWQEVTRNVIRYVG